MMKTQAKPRNPKGELLVGFFKNELFYSFLSMCQVDFLFSVTWKKIQSTNTYICIPQIL